MAGDSWYYNFNWLSQYPAFLSSVSEPELGRSSLWRDPSLFSRPGGVKASREKSMKKVCVGGARGGREKRAVSHQLSTYLQTRKLLSAHVIL